MKLATLCAHLVPLLDVEMSDLNELQRSLKERSAHFDPESEINIAVIAAADRAGVAHAPDILKGKPGPGGGIEMGAFNTAFFLLAIAISGPRRESARKTWRTWHMHHGELHLNGVPSDELHTVSCPLTGCALFGDAIKAMLASEDMAERVSKVVVVADKFGEIHFDEGKVSRFTFGRFEIKDEPRLYRPAVMSGDVFRKVGQRLRQSQDDRRSAQAHEIREAF